MTQWLYQNPLETKQDFQGPVSTERLVRLMVDETLSDVTWVKRIDDGKTGFAGSFADVAHALLLAIDDLVPRWVGRSARRPSWAHGWLQSVAEEQPDVAWSIVLALVQRARSDDDLMWVGAGPLETLLAHHGASVVTRLEGEAPGNQPLRKALSGVWRSSISDDVWRRVTTVLRSSR